MKKLLLFLILAAGGGTWWYVQHNKPEAPEYVTATIQKGDITQIVTSTGTLKPYLNVTVGCQISGTIAELNADFNSAVKEGDILAKLDPATYQAIVLQAEGELASAKASLELAELTAKRKQDLVRQNAAPQAELDTAHANLHQAEATVQIKQGSLQRAMVDLSRCTIYSPISGLVISRNVDVGQTVAASLSAPILFSIANDMTKMQISASVSEADVGTVAEGQSVEFTVDAFPYTAFTGKVQQIRNSPVTVQSVVTYDVIVEVANPDLKLKPGMTANVSITVAQRKGVVRIPNAALRFRPPESLVAATQPKEPAPTAAPGEAPQKPKGGSKSARNARPDRKVHILRPGSEIPEPVTLKLGITDNLTTEVLEGINEGDVVVTSLKNPPAPAAAASPAANPLGGSPMRPRGR
ncbi:MAG: efflux RND transporter periplasmic adaptor subunit [Verrucomicrobiota bacterium]